MDSKITKCIILVVLLYSCEKHEFKNDIEGLWKIESISGGIVPTANIITPNYDYLQLKNSDTYLILRNDSIIEKGNYALKKNVSNNSYGWYIIFNEDFNYDPSLAFDNSYDYYIKLISNDTLIFSQKDIEDGASFFYTRH